MMIGSGAVHLFETRRWDLRTHLSASVVARSPGSRRSRVGPRTPVKGRLTGAGKAALGRADFCRLPHGRSRLALMLHRADRKRIQISQNRNKATHTEATLPIGESLIHAISRK